MTVAERKELCRLLSMMDRQKEFSKKIGLINTSTLKTEKRDNKWQEESK